MYKFILAFRYMFKRRISYLALLSVVLCVFIVIVVMTVMGGLVNDFKEKNHAFVGDCVITSDSLVGFAYYQDLIKDLAATDVVDSFSPAIKNYALLNPGWSEQTFGVQIIGIDPVAHSHTTGFKNTLYYRKNAPERAFEPIYDSNLAGCVVGIDMVIARDSNSDYSHTTIPQRQSFEISCIPLTSKGALAKAGTDIVNTKIFHYSDTSHSGLARVDSSVIYLPFQYAQQLCGMEGTDPRVNDIFIKFTDKVSLEQGTEKISNIYTAFVDRHKNDPKADLFNNVSVQTWKQYRRQFIAAMEKEQLMIMIMFMLVAVTVVFVVLAVFYMIITHKSKDIGILKSAGVSDSGILAIFFGFAFWLGLIGSIIGVAFGWLFIARMNQIEKFLYQHFGFQLWDRTIYAIGKIPDQLEIKLIVAVVTCSIFVCVLGAILPALRAARTAVIQTLQVTRL